MISVIRGRICCLRDISPSWKLCSSFSLSGNASWPHPARSPPQNTTEPFSTILVKTTTARSTRFLVTKRSIAGCTDTLSVRSCFADPVMIWEMDLTGHGEDLGQFFSAKDEAQQIESWLVNRGIRDIDLMFSSSAPSRCMMNIYLVNRILSVISA